MPRYSPLPAVSIDPRNEAAIAQQAAQVVYEASNQTLNDFSSGNPLAALIEGQAFAQGEFLYWANQLPEKILIEWIGPFLGAMRRLGTPSTVRLRLSIPPQDTPFVLPVGSPFTTNPQLTGGQSYEFVTGEEITIPAGETQGFVTAYSKFVGSAYNVPANSVVSSSAYSASQSYVTNLQPAVGGSDVETYDQVKERFFNLIRRKNPVSESDWQDFFTDLFGQGTVTSVQPNRSSKISYNYEADYSKPNGQVSFFVLGPNGVELTEDQIRVGQQSVNSVVPVENQGHLFPITLSRVQYNLNLEVEPNGSFGRNFRQASLDFRNRLFEILQPGNVFPPTMNPSPGDIDAAFYSTFDASVRFTDPRIISSVAFNTPNLLNSGSATLTRVLKFTPSNFLLSEGDLVKEVSPNETFYPVNQNFTPYSASKFDQTIYKNLKLKQIETLVSGTFVTGDVIYYDGSLRAEQEGLHVVLTNLAVGSQEEFLRLIDTGKISQSKDYSAWIPGNSYQYMTNGLIDPDLVEYDYSEGEFIPASPSSVPLNKRPGALVWVVAKNFTLGQPTNTVSQARDSLKLGDPITPITLTPGSSYQPGDWVVTPQVGSGPNSQVDPTFFYVDFTKGVVEKFAEVQTSFTYNPGEQTVSAYFDKLSQDSTIREVNVYDGTDGLPVYKYKPRFKAGQYLEYRANSDGGPSYLIASEFFTPPSANLSELVSRGYVINLAPTPELYTQLTGELKSGFSGQIEKLTLVDGGNGYSPGTYANVPLTGSDGLSATANIVISGGKAISVFVNNRGQRYRVGDILTANSSFLGGSGTGLVVRVSSIGEPSENRLNVPVRMFSFFKGDRTFFRNGSDVQTYVANESVSPLFGFEVYFKNGVFSKQGGSGGYDPGKQGYVPFYRLNGDHSEDTIVSDDGKDFYRVMRAFSPVLSIESWSGPQRANSPRFEEYSGNLLRYVSAYSCDERILPQFGQETSSIKLGDCQITLVPRSSAQNNSSNQSVSFVWESTDSLAQSPELSWFTGTTFGYNPPDYKTGTLAL